MRGFTADGGRKLGIRLTHLMVPVELDLRSRYSAPFIEMLVDWRDDKTAARQEGGSGAQRWQRPDGYSFIAARYALPHSRWCRRY